MEEETKEMEHFHQNSQHFHHNGYNSNNYLNYEEDYYSHGGLQTSTNNPHQMNPVTVVVEPSGQQNIQVSLNK